MKPDDGQQPGQTIVPDAKSSGGAVTPPSGPSAAASPPLAPAATVATPAAVVTSSPAAPPASRAPMPASMPGEQSAIYADPQDPEAITWTASEYIAHAKSFGWYAALGGGAVVFAAIVFLVTRDVVSTAVVLVAALLLGIYAGRPPRQLEYRIDRTGIGVGQKRFGYGDFRFFSIMDEGAFSSIVFMPLKRFAVPTTIYYAPQDEDRIVGLLSDKLPMENRNHDAVDRLMHRIRF